MSESAAEWADALGVVALAADGALSALHEAREAALRCCRVTIQASGRSIRAIHRSEKDVAQLEAVRAEEALRGAQEVLAGYPAIAAAGFLHDAEKEYAEARLFAALVSGNLVPGHFDVRVSPSAWFNGLAEAASELRRYLLDRLREGRLDAAETLLGAMDDVYAVLITVDYPDAVTGGLRRTTDGFRAVLERTRSDLTTTVLQSRLQTALMSRLERP